MTYSSREEFVHAVSHGLGLALSALGTVYLLMRAAGTGSTLRMLAVAVYGLSLILMFGSSSLYHSAPRGPRKRAWQTLDRSSIFLLIAGTYTPFTLITLRGTWGWTLFALVWSAAVTGVSLSVFGPRRLKLTLVPLYLAMGWLGAVAIVPLFRSLTAGGLALLVAGGVTFTVGVLFYGWHRLPYNHAIWHIFVLLGAALHFFAVLVYVVPLSAGA